MKSFFAALCRQIRPCNMPHMLLWLLLFQLARADQDVIIRVDTSKTHPVSDKLFGMCLR